MARDNCPRPPKYSERLPAHPDTDIPLNRLRALCGESAQQDLHRAPTSETSRDTKDGSMDELARSQQYNSKMSILHRLPEGIVADKIMAELDWLSMYCLRHTSRHFMRLFSENPDIFDTRLRMMGCSIRHTGLLVHDAITGSRNSIYTTKDIGNKNTDGNNDDYDDYAPPWATMSFPMDYKSTWPRYKMLVSRSLYDSRHCHRQFNFSACGGAGGGSFQSEYMHCSKCHADHPTRMFSATACKQGVEAQLNMLHVNTEEAAANGPVCIAHEGHVRICEHKTVTYAEVLASLPRGALYEDESSSAYIPKSLGVSFDFGRTPDQYAPFRVEPYLRLICDHPSHVPQHHQEKQSKLWRKFKLSNPFKRILRAREQPPVLADMQPPTYKRFAGKDEEVPGQRQAQEGPGYFPSFLVHDLMTKRLEDSEDKHKVITWSYTAHVDLSSVNPSSTLTAQKFRDAVSKMRGGHSPARYIAPEDCPGILQELRCVDPTRCGCLVYPGWTGSRKMINLPNETNGEKECRQHAVVRRLYSRVSDLDTIHTRLDSCSGCSQNQGDRCLMITYTRTIRLTTDRYSVDPSPMWKPAVVYRGDGLGRRQRMKSGELNLRLEDAFRNHTVVPYGWYQALDPKSYEVYGGDEDDNDRYQVTWCRGKRCRLNPKFLREHIVSGQEMNAACLYGCSGGPGSAGADASLSSMLPWTAQAEPAFNQMYKTRPPPLPFCKEGERSSPYELPHHSSCPFEYPLRDQWDGWRLVNQRPRTTIWLGAENGLDQDLFHDGIDYEAWEKAARENRERWGTHVRSLRDLHIREEFIVKALEDEVQRARSMRDAIRDSSEGIDGCVSEYNGACRVLELREQALTDARLENDERLKALRDGDAINFRIEKTLDYVRERVGARMRRRDALTTDTQDRLQ